MSFTLYRFRLSVSDVDRAYYDSLDIRVALHPSETPAFLVTRVLAYALNYQSGLAFSTGLSTPDEPAIRLEASGGGTALWIDIGNPSTKRLHKAAKASRAVRIYTYKDPENLKREAAGETIHRKDEIEIFAMDPKFLDGLARTLEKDNSWSILHNEGELVVTTGEDQSHMTTLVAHRL